MGTGINLWCAEVGRTIYIAEQTRHFKITFKKMSLLRIVDF